MRLPGREVRINEPPLDRVGSMVEALVGPLEAVAAEGPYALFGHSLGAITGFELARELARRGNAPAHLFVSGRCAPHIPHGIPEIHRLPDRQFLDAVCDLGGMPTALLEARELLDMLLPALRADFTAAETYGYQPGPPLELPITALGGHDDTVGERKLLAWRAQTTSAFRLRLLPGDHFYLHAQRGPLCAAIVDDLAAGGTAGGQVP
jgi:medium-chain acyl-[acyl-carrier-protein] hydrolase